MGWTYQGRPIGGRTLPGYGDCSPPEPEHPMEGFNIEEDTNLYDRLAHCGYEYDFWDKEWTKHVSTTRHVCRRDHKDGTVRAGDHYVKRVHRVVCDETGKSWHAHSKHVTKPAGVKS